MYKLYIRRYTLGKIVDICNVSVKDHYTADIDSIVTYLETDKSLNTSKNKYITHSTDGVFFVKDINKPDDESNVVKLGKILQQISKDKLKPEEIESMVSDWKKAYTIDTSIVQTSDNIGDVYNISTCGGSCMAHKGEFMQIYKDFGCKIAYITGDNGDLLARALLWHNLNYKAIEGESAIKQDNFIDRIFYEKEEHKLTLQKWAKENGYKNVDIKKYTYWTDEIPVEYYDDCGVPYIDTMYYITYNDSNMYLSSYREEHTDYHRDEFRETTGQSSYETFGIEPEDLVYCEDLGDSIPSDYATWIERGSYYVSSDYECLAYIEEWDMYVDTEDDDGVVWAEDAQRFIPLEDAYSAEDTDLYYSSPDELYYCEDDGCWYEYDDELCVTEDDGTTRFKDNCYCVAETGEWYLDEENYLERLKELNDEKL